MHPEKSDTLGVSAFLGLLFKSLAPFFLKDQNQIQMVPLLFILAIIFANIQLTYCIVYYSYWQRGFMTALETKDQANFHAHVGTFFVLLVVLGPVCYFRKFVQGVFTIRWRKSLTNYLLEGYYANLNFYKLCFKDEIDNLDQRIAEECHKFTDTSTDLLVSLFRSIIMIISFSYVLFDISGPLCAFALVYSFLGSGLMAYCFMSRLIFLARAIKVHEGTFRYCLVRTRENAESIAFYRGGLDECVKVQGFLERVITTRLKFLKIAILNDVMTHVYFWITDLIPFLLLAPLFFGGSLDFGAIYQTKVAFSEILDGLAYIVRNTDDLAELGAQSSRIGELIDAIMGKHMETEYLVIPQSPCLSTGNLSPHFERSASDSVVCMVQHLCIRVPFSPNREPVVENLSFQVVKGKHLLIMGCSGSGKSSILRVLAGLWGQSSGVISCVHLEHCLFLPQKSYFILGSLWENLVYPDSNLNLGEAEAHRIMSQCGLEHIYEQYGLKRVMNWSLILSLGEQQRFAFARLFCQKASLVLLDEATSALDLEWETKMYTQLANRKNTIVSVGHRQSLLRFHHRLLMYTGSAWTESAIESAS